MLRRTITLSLLALAIGVPASAASTAYDRAASMAAGETPLTRGYDGANAAGAVKAPVDAVSGSLGLSAPGSARVTKTHTLLDAASVPSPAMTVGFKAAGAAVGAVAGGAFAGPIGAVIGAFLGFGIALMVSKLLG